MKKIIVAIDFSPNSKKTIRFGIQLASQIEAELHFLHIIGIVAPVVDTTMNFSYYSQFPGEDVLLRQKELQKLVKSVYDARLPKGVTYNCVCELGTEVSSAVINYAETQKADFICTGARGNSTLAKIFGSIATQLITSSTIPVFVVPKNYRVRPVSTICYASDMTNLEAEMNKVIGMASMLPATITVLHFDYEVLPKQNLEKWNTVSEKYKTEGAVFQYKKSNALTPLNDHLRKAIADFKPNLFILFTRHGRNWYERLILSSKSAELSFTAKVPLLIYKKSPK